MNPQYTETVTFVSHEARSVNTRFGPKTVNDFVDTQNRKFSVWKADVAATLVSFMNQPVTVIFEAKQNGEFMNYDVQSAFPAAGGAAVPTPAAPVAAPQAAPQAAPAQTAPAQAPAQNNGVSGAEKDARISRAASLDRALTAFGISQEDPLANLEALYDLSNEFFAYITTGSSSAEASSLATAAQGPTV